MAFHVVSSFLLRVLASKTTFWMAWIFQQPIRCFYFMVSEANTRIKKEDTTWKAMKSWARKCYIFLCTINFEVTCPFWKMWPPNLPRTVLLLLKTKFYLFMKDLNQYIIEFFLHFQTVLWMLVFINEYHTYFKHFFILAA